MTMQISHRRRVKLEELNIEPFSDLLAIAAAQSIYVQTSISRWEVIARIMRSAYNSGAQLSVEGPLKVMPQGFGMIKIGSCTDLHLPSDVYVSPTQIKFLGLSDGAMVFASIRPPRRDESYFAFQDLLN